MKKGVRRLISTILSGTLTIGALTGSLVTSAYAEARKIDVWDFGAVAQAGDMYANHITTSQLDSLTFINDGTIKEIDGAAIKGTGKGMFMVTGEYDFGNGLKVSAVEKDRLYYLDASGEPGAKCYGTLSQHATTAYPDGYTAAGEYYCNGTGKSTSRMLLLDDCKAGDAISVYANTSNSNAGTLVLSNLTDTTVAEVRSDFEVGGSRCDFVVPADGNYKIYVESAGKPIFNRVVRYPGIAVSGKVNLNGLTVPDYGVSFENKTTGDKTEATVASDGSYSITLAPGYTYTGILTGATGFGFTNASKTVEVTADDCATGTKTADFDVEVKQTYKASGEITGFDSSYDLSRLTLSLVPTAESLAETVAVTLTGTSFSDVMLEPDIDYTAVLEGVNDYEITSGGVFNSTKDITQNIAVAPKALHTVKGFLTYDADYDLSATPATAISFTNIEDGYTYEAAVSDGSYSISLRNGSYSAVITAPDSVKTNSHVVVNGKDVSKDLYIVPSVKEVKSVDWSSDIYVGKDKTYSTVGEALTAIKGMGVDSEAKRVTVHIDPGTYREQLIVDTPYVTFMNDTGEEVLLTWYYGIGYKYYSADSTGYYNLESYIDSYAKNNVAKWGVATYIKESATGFRAEGITFENSFNKYVTDEEIADGVELAPPTDSYINVVRRLSTDVASKAATERAAAIAIEADNVEFEGCSFIGSQDTLYTGSKDYNQYYKNCTIEGQTDYIFGDGNCVFDGCELRWCGYSVGSVGGYITAAKDTAAYGYLFRNCTVTGDTDNTVTAGCFGRPWSQGARVTFTDTKLQSSDYISAEGWGTMRGNSPEKANYAEYNTTYGGAAVDTAGRLVAPLTERPATDVTAYFGDWTPTYYVAESGTPAFAETPSLSSTGDINIPYTGETISAHWLLTDPDNDASQVSWYLVDEAGNETLVASGTAAANIGYTPSADAVGKLVKITVTPEYISGAKGTAASFITAAALKKGSGGTEVVDPSRVGKTAIFLAGDSTVKDYSAGAINNTGAVRVEGSWGEYLQSFFNKEDVQVFDYAQGGRSSWSFIYDGAFFDKIKEKLQPGDYLFIQFGHNDCSESYTDRYVPLGEPDANGIYPITAPTDETGSTVATRGTFKYYLNLYIDMAKEKGATPVLVTPVSRMYFDEKGNITPHHDADSNTDKSNTYCTAVKQLGEEKGVQVIDLFTYTENLYEQAYKDDTTASAGVSALAKRLFAPPSEKTHHSKLGGLIIAAQMANEIKDNITDLGESVTAPHSVDGLTINDENEFMVSRAGVLTAYDTDENDNYTVTDTYWSDYGNKLFEKLNGKDEPVVEGYTYGSADGDDTVTAADAAMLLQKVLTDAKTTLEALTSDFMQYLDVDEDGILTAQDAAHILQKALDNSYQMPVELPKG